MLEGCFIDLNRVIFTDMFVFLWKAYQLDDLIRSIYNDTQCPCNVSICRHEGQGGYLIGIAIIRAMKLDRNIRKLNYSRYVYISL